MLKFMKIGLIVCILVMSNYCKNLIKNPNFDKGMESWNYYSDNSAVSEAYVLDNNCCKMFAYSGSNEMWHVHIRQNNIRMIQGRTYTFRFQAMADKSRRIYAMVEKNGEPYTQGNRMKI